MSKYSAKMRAMRSGDGMPFLQVAGIIIWDRGGDGDRIVSGRTYSVTLQINEVNQPPQHTNCRCTTVPVRNAAQEKYEEFMSRSPEEVTLAIFDRLGVKLTPRLNHDDNDRSWAE